MTQLRLDRALLRQWRQPSPPCFPRREAISGRRADCCWYSAPPRCEHRTAPGRFDSHEYVSLAVVCDWTYGRIYMPQFDETSPTAKSNKLLVLNNDRELVCHNRACTLSGVAVEGRLCSILHQGRIGCRGRSRANRRGVCSPACDRVVAQGCHYCWSNLSGLGLRSFISTTPRSIQLYLTN